MGQKIHPLAFRLGQFYTWNSRWFAKKGEYARLLLEDYKIRKNLMPKLKNAQISGVEIERLINKIEITVHVARPGVVIGRGGQGLEELKKYLENLLGLKKEGKNPPKLDLRIEPVKEPNLNAYLMAQNIADQLIKRFPHRRVVHQAMNRVMAAGAKGIKIQLSGRIAGAEIARREKYQEGTVPLTTLREKIDFAVFPALTKSGYVGVKVWICQS